MKTVRDSFIYPFFRVGFSLAVLVAIVIYTVAPLGNRADLYAANIVYAYFVLQAMTSIVVLFCKDEQRDKIAVQLTETAPEILIFGSLSIGLFAATGHWWFVGIAIWAMTRDIEMFERRMKLESKAKIDARIRRIFLPDDELDTRERDKLAHGRAQ